MAEFRYKGVTVAGEVTDENGMTFPNIKRSVDVYGYTFHEKKYTTVPDDAVAYETMNVNRQTRKSEPASPLIVDKLRGNREFEERIGDSN